MRRGALLTALLLCAPACRSRGPELPPEWELGGQTRGYHEGPTVAAGTEATFVPAEALLASWSAATEPGSLASARAGIGTLEDALRESGAGALPDASIERADGVLRLTLRGRERAHETVVVAALLEPGAPEGAAGLVEGARALARALEARALRAPRRTLVLLWGAPADLARELGAGAAPIALLFGDHLGLPAESGGAVATLERGVDPGFFAPMPPDPASSISDEAGPAPAVAPNGLALVVRLALVDVGILARPWASRERQWSGAHDALAELCVPSARVTCAAAAPSGVELGAPALRRTSCALVAAGFAVANAGPADLDRYLKSLAFERRLRVNSAAMEGAEHALILEWEAWCTGARHWLRRLCLGLPLDGSGD